VPTLGGRQCKDTISNASPAYSAARKPVPGMSQASRFPNLPQTKTRPLEQTAAKPHGQLVRAMSMRSSYHEANLPTTLLHDPPSNTVNYLHFT